MRNRNKKKKQLYELLARDDGLTAHEIQYFIQQEDEDQETQDNMWRVESAS